MTTDVAIEVTAFDTEPTGSAARRLRPACASEAWIDAVVAGRPYGSLDEVTTRSDEVVAGLAWPDVEEALAAHPRIGERAGGPDVEAAWSRQEQAGAASSEEDVVALYRGNLEYEQRFGHVFLICATGRTSEQMLAALRERLGNDPAAERDVVRCELAAIVRLRLARVLR